MIKKKAEMRVGNRFEQGDFIAGQSDATSGRFFWKFTYKKEGVTTEKMGIVQDGIGSLDGAVANGKARGVVFLDDD